MFREVNVPTYLHLLQHSLLSLVFLLLAFWFSWSVRPQLSLPVSLCKAQQTSQASPKQRTLNLKTVGPEAQKPLTLKLLTLMEPSYNPKQPYRSLFCAYLLTPLQNSQLLTPDSGSLPLSSGTPMSNSRSKRPNRRRAASMEFGLSRFPKSRRYYLGSRLLGGSWDLVSISPLIGVISNYLVYNPSY